MSDPQNGVPEPMDKVKYNHAYNKLKEVVGESGAFILFVTKPRLHGQMEEFRFATHGDISRVLGLLKVAGAHTERELMARAENSFKQLPKEPD